MPDALPAERIPLFLRHQNQSLSQIQFLKKAAMTAFGRPLLPLRAPHFIVSLGGQRMASIATASRQAEFPCQS